MKRESILMITVLSLISAIFIGLYAQSPPTFYSGVRLQKNGQDLVNMYSGYNNFYSVPCVGDWNGDNKKDLLVGYFFEGWAFLYPNSGTNGTPLFSTENQLQAGGNPIAVGYD